MENPTNSKDTRVEGNEVLLSEAFEAYREIIVYKNQSPKTEESHLVCQKALIKYFGDIQIELLTPEMVRKWKLELDKGRQPTTVRSYIIKLRVVLDYLRKEGYDVIDTDRIPVPKRPETVPAFISKEQVAFLIDSTSSLRSKTIISLLYSSGVRVSELCSLNRDSIHDGTFTIIGKGGKARLCFVDQRTQEFITLYLETREDNERALFISRLSKKRITPGNVQEIFKHLKKKTGIEAHPHTMRHSFCTNLLQSNTNLYYVQRLMGHQSLQTTQQYLHVVDLDLQKIYTEHHTI
jgi:site-specific recombinase XerD